MNVALPLVVAGAVADGVLAELGELVEGDVDCASALVNARPLTAATAMMFLSMYASWASLLKRVMGSPAQTGFLKEATREPGRCSRRCSKRRTCHAAIRGVKRLRPQG